MRKFFYFILISVFSFNCQFLEESPTDRLVTNNFYNSPEDAESAINAVYQSLYPIYNRLMYILCDLPTDDMKNGLGMPNPFLQDLEYLRHNDENAFVYNMWRDSYSGIMRANTAIAKIPDIVMDDGIKERMIGEAKFIRSLFYFNLIRFFGDVPLINNLETIDDALIPRNPIEEVYDFIIDDLKFAVSVLPTRLEYKELDVGRATKSAAKILLGKVYLFRRDFASSSLILEEVVEIEDKLGHRLHESYGDNWNTETQNGAEAVFYLEFKGRPLPANGEMDLIGPKYSIPGGNIGVAGSNEADIPTQELYDAYHEFDTRRDVNLRYEFENPKTGEILTSSIPLFGKYWKDGIEASNECDINMHVIRYSDALLMLAESLNELGDTDAALQYLNRVRERAFHSSDFNYDNISQNEFRDLILLERRLEFPLEGHRWFDLVRTNTFVERMNSHSIYEAEVAESNKTEISKNISEFMNLYPIPRREIDLNPKLQQNPGW